MIDRMVRESIERLLPEVMNEVLLRTLAGSGVLREQAPAQRPAAPQRQQPKRKPAQPSASQRAQELAGINRSMSLREALNADSSGADFYEQAERMMRPPSPRPAPIQEVIEYDDPDSYEYEDEAPVQSHRQQVMAQRLSQLPPQLQALAEDTFRLVEGDEGDDEMWGDNEFAPDITEPSQASAPPLNIDRAAKAANVDFNRAQQLLGLTEQKKPTRVDPDEFRRQQQWKLEQLERKRRELESQKVG